MGLSFGRQQHVWGAGVGYPEPAERAGSEQHNDQQARLPLVGARGMERGTHVSSLIGSQHRRGTSVSRELHKKKVSNLVMAKRRPSENNLCENGTGVAKSVIPRKGPTCEDSGFSIVVAGIRLSFKTSANMLAEHGPEVVPCTGETRSQHQRKITPPETTGRRAGKCDTLSGREPTAKENSPSGTTPEVRGRESLVKLPDQRRSQAPDRAGKCPVFVGLPFKMAGKQSDW